MASHGFSTAEEYLDAIESQKLIEECQCTALHSTHYKMVKAAWDSKVFYKIKSQRKVTLLPALKYFTDLFGDQGANIYDIPERYVQKCGYLDQFHWALIAEYFDVSSLKFLINLVADF
jgi:hypothetical protein